MEQILPEHLSVGVEHLRRNLPAIMAKVEGGGATVTVTDYGRPVAQIVPMSGEEKRGPAATEASKCPPPAE